MSNGPYITSRKAEVAVGLAFFAAGALLLRDAYDQRGVPQPWYMRPFSFW